MLSLIPRCRKAKPLFGLLLSLLVAGPSVAREAVSPEVRIVTSIDSRHDEAVDLLRRLVEVNSGTLNFEGVRRVSELLIPEFESLGFTTEWIAGEPFDRAGHLVARRASGAAIEAPVHLLLIGHLDTVFEPGSPFSNWEDLGNGRIRGPGTTDMKGGLVVMLEALRALHATEILDTLTLTVVLTGDEESSGRPLELSREVLIAAGAEADVALGFEDGDGDPTTAVIARRGSARWELSAVGNPAHSSQIFAEGVGAGAIQEVVRILDRFRIELPLEKDLTYNPGLIVGGSEIRHDPATARAEAYGKNNVVAEFAQVTGDLRTVSPEQLLRAKEMMFRIVGESLPGTQAKLTIHDGYPPMGATQGNRKLLEIYSRASQQLGFGPVAAVDPRNAGAADISFVAGDVEMALDGLGLMGTGGHTDEETADLATLPRQTKRAALLIYRLSQQP